MNDSEVEDYLRDNGYPEPLVREGKPGLVRLWREFVEHVERGYSRGLEDYRKDLDIRAILRLAGAEDPEVLALDQRFGNMLKATNRRVWESAAGDPYWDFGYPRNAGPALMDGLREEGLTA
ncbi:MAG TPA: hypothetical protein VFW83_04400 [Bryobacteraceae bacterium]|nr:hypothetical protein [Bryobacteraceae bacterium]